MTRPTDAVRAAVRKDWQQPGLRLVGCSGGPDSLALAAGTAQVSRQLGWPAGAVIVDHGLQPDSAAVAASAAGTCRELGLDPVLVRRVEVVPTDGPEASARRARYQAFAAVAEQTQASAVLLAHTLDDQAETVLLGLARGSGTRSLAGMPAAAGLIRRPLLGLRRSVVAQAAADWGLQPWLDPHNDDLRYTRVRVRQLAMPALTEALGPGVPEALARTAHRLSQDEEALADWAAQVVATGVEAGDLQPGRQVLVALLAAQPAAVRTRILHQMAVAAGCAPTDLTHEHVSRMDALVTDWRGQGPINLPAGVDVQRRYGSLVLGPTTVNGDHREPR